jgi:hypothetical protein
MRPLAAAALTALALTRAPDARACTTFLLSSSTGPVVGKSYDWHQGQALVFVNKRGVAKKSLPMLPGDRPAAWVSKHASITFNQYGRELPNGGMNDAGLVVEVMWLDASRYPQPDARPTVNELQWIQYQLDNFGTVAEMIAAADQLRVSLVHGKVHYLACDRAAACAAFEHVGGKLVVTSGGALPVKALTNDTYAASLAHLSSQKGEPRDRGSLARFVTAARSASRPPAGDAVGAAWSTLEGVRTAASQWTIVYEPAALRVQFKTLAKSRLKVAQLGRFPSSCKAGALALDMDTDAEGDVTSRFAPATADANRQLVERSLAGIRARLPPGAIERLAAYPDMLPCTER